MTFVVDVLSVLMDRRVHVHTFGPIGGQNLVSAFERRDRIPGGP